MNVEEGSKPINEYRPEAPTPLSQENSIDECGWKGSPLAAENTIMNFKPAGLNIEASPWTPLGNRSKPETEDENGTPIHKQTNKEQIRKQLNQIKLIITACTECCKSKKECLAAATIIIVFLGQLGLEIFKLLSKDYLDGKKGIGNHTRLKVATNIY
jgi:hypothetical protein